MNFKSWMPPVEMDRIPLPGAEPLLDECGAALRVAAIRRDAMEVGLTLQQFAHWLRVGDRNGVANEQGTRGSPAWSSMAARGPAFAAFGHGCAWGC